MGYLVVDEIELIMRERPWLPWYERYGPDFKSEMFRYPLERITPPVDSDDTSGHKHTLAVADASGRSDDNGDGTGSSRGF